MDDFVADDSHDEPIVETVPRMMDDFIANATRAAEVDTEAIPNVAIWFFMMKIAWMKNSFHNGSHLEKCVR